MKKQGISLIVLVITIIVLAILAAAVIISINNTGIINSSQQTVLTEAYGTLTDLLTMKYTDLKVKANLPTKNEEGKLVDPTGVILEADAAKEYDLAMTEAGFKTATKLTGIATPGVYTKTNGSHTITVTITLAYDGVYTLKKEIDTAKVTG